jgi:hypothetical protein
MNQKNQIANIYNEKTITNQGKPLRGNQMLKKRNLNAQEEELNPTKKNQNPTNWNLKPTSRNSKPNQEEFETHKSQQNLK